MNLEPYNLNYQDGLNSYPIIDYIDAKIAESGGNIIIDGQPLTNLIYSSSNNTYINNANINHEIRFKTPVSYFFTDGNHDYAVKIYQMGKIQVYHPYNVLQPTFSAGWYDVEFEIMGLKADGLSIDIQLTGLEGSVAFLQTEVSTIESALSSLMQSSVYMQTEIDTLSQLTGNEFELLEDSKTVNEINERFQGYLLRNTNVWSYKIEEGIKWAFGGAVVGAIGAIGGYIATQQLSNMAAKLEYSNLTLTPAERRNLIDLTSNAEKDYTSNFDVSMSNLSLEHGFINSNILTDQFIPTLKSDKIMLGNITTPNVAYQMEMTGDLNLNMLYLNSTSLSSLLNQKQGNLTFTQPLYNTTNTIGLNYDSSLTKIGNNLSVVKTATTPILITGNNWALNYDSTLILSGNNLSVASATASKWTQSGNNIYNNNTGNIGIGSQIPAYKLDVRGDIKTNSKINVVSDGVVTSAMTRQINLIGTDAVMRVWRTNATNAPAYELRWKNGLPTSDSDYTYWWDMYLSVTSSSFVIRDRSGGTNKDRFIITSAGSCVMTNGVAAAPSLGTYGGNGDKADLWVGSVSAYPYSLGVNSQTLWYSIPSTASHRFFIGGTEYFTILAGGNIGIGNNNPTGYKLDVNGTFNSGNITCGTITTNNNAINAGTGNISAATFTGGLKPSVNIWHTSTDAKNRFYFANNSTTYYGSQDGHEWRNNNDSRIMNLDKTGALLVRGELGFINRLVNVDTPGDHIRLWHNGDNAYMDVGGAGGFVIRMNNDATTYPSTYNGILSVANSGDVSVLNNFGCGQLTCTMTSVANSGTDYVGVQVNTSQGTNYYTTLKIMYGSFTGFHRFFCDDELFDRTNETTMNYFKNNYIGRVVISTGKIKTHTQEFGKDEWFALEDKDGITIEDTHCIVRLSNKKKDKKVIGVIGLNRNNSAPDRIIVNSVGEGAIWIVNSNGNLILNGDLLQTSDKLGYAERQDDDIIRNYTIGKVMMDCDFELDSPYYKCEVIEGGFRKAFVACVYYCG